MLVQLLRGPYALAIDAVSFLWSALFLGRIDADDPPAGPESTGGILAGARWIRGNAIIRAELLGVATLNFFNFIYFALFLLYATRELHVQPAALGVVLGVASVGTTVRLGGHRTRLAPDRRRACVPDRLLPLPRAAHPRAGRRRAALARARRACSPPSSSPASA